MLLRICYDVPHHNCIESSGVHWRISKNTYRVQIRSGTLMDCHTRLGAYSYIGRNCMLTKCSIGRYCSIGDNVTIGPGEHSLDCISTSAHFYQGERVYDCFTREECSIGNDVWIGTRAIILRGVSIGDGAVIGANAVVTKNVPSFSIVCGVPAKVRRLRLTEEARSRVLSSKWWKSDLDEAKKIIEEFSEID